MEVPWWRLCLREGRKIKDDDWDREEKKSAYAWRQSKRREYVAARTAVRRGVGRWRYFMRERRRDIRC